MFEVVWLLGVPLSRLQWTGSQPGNVLPWDPLLVHGQEELTFSLDAAGQVYIFGLGQAGQFSGQCRRDKFRGWTKVWRRLLRIFDLIVD